MYNVWKDIKIVMQPQPGKSKKRLILLVVLAVIILTALALLFTQVGNIGEYTLKKYSGPGYEVSYPEEFSRSLVNNTDTRVVFTQDSIAENIESKEYIDIRGDYSKVSPITKQEAQRIADGLSDKKDAHAELKKEADRDVLYTRVLNKKNGYVLIRWTYFYQDQTASVSIQTTPNSKLEKTSEKIASSFVLTNPAL